MSQDPIQTPDTDRQHLEHLMMAALDGELAPGERTELDIALERDPALRDEWERLSNLQEVTRMTRITTPPDTHWDGYWHSIYNRLERGFGWLLVSLGATVLGLQGLWDFVHELLADTSVPDHIRWATFALMAGGLVLAISVLRERLSSHKHDPYKEIDR